MSDWSVEDSGRRQRVLFAEQLILIRGAGALATGVALRLHRAGFPVVMLELPEPLALRRTVAFAEAVRQGTVSIEGVVARRVEQASEVRRLAPTGEVPVLVDPDGERIPRLRPAVVVDARCDGHRRGDTTREQARLVIGLGHWLYSRGDGARSGGHRTGARFVGGSCLRRHP